MNEPCILLVEDDDECAATVTETLVAAGYDVDRARNGEEGLSRLRQGYLPRLILLDWSMPIMSAPEMIAAMEPHPSWRALPVVLLTAHEDAKSKALALRAAAYLKKPLDSDVLLRLVNDLLREQTTFRLRRTVTELGRAAGAAKV